MRPEEVSRHLRQKPFLPFRIFVSDGSEYEVHDPEYAYVSRREVVVGLDGASGGIPDSSAYLDPIHITRIEPIPGGAPRDQS